MSSQDFLTFQVHLVCIAFRAPVLWWRGTTLQFGVLWVAYGHVLPWWLNLPEISRNYVNMILNDFDILWFILIFILYIYIHLHIYIYTYIHTYIYTYTYIYIYIFLAFDWVPDERKVGNETDCRWLSNHHCQFGGSRAFQKEASRSGDGCRQKGQGENSYPLEQDVL